MCKLIKSGILVKYISFMDTGRMISQPIYLAELLSMNLGSANRTLDYSTSPQLAGQNTIHELPGIVPGNTVFLL